MLFESLPAPKSNPLLAVEELHFTKQGSMNSGELYEHVVKIVKRCKFSCAKAEERAIRDTIFLDMNNIKDRGKAINLINQEGKELTVDFLMQQLEREDCNAHQKSLSQLDSRPPAPGAHVHKLPPQVLKPRDLLALRQVQHQHNGRTCVNRLPLMKQDILSHYSGCFEGIGHFPGNHTNFTLNLSTSLQDLLQGSSNPP